MTGSAPTRLAAPPETLDDDPRLAELSSPRLVAVTTEVTARQALRMLGELRVRHLPVMDGERCIGVLFERDLFRHVLEATTRRETAATAAQLCRPVAMLPHDARRSRAATTMLRDHTDAVLVTQYGRVTAIVTATDLIKSLAQARW